MPKRSYAEFRSLHPAGLDPYPIEATGDCLFASIAKKIHQDENEHLKVRSAVMEELVSNSLVYNSFVTTRYVPTRAKKVVSTKPGKTPTAKQTAAKIKRYLKNMAKEHVFGTELEITAAANAFNAKIVLHQRRQEPRVYQPRDPAEHTIHIIYHGMMDEHYDATVPKTLPPSFSEARWDRRCGSQPVRGLDLA